MPPSRKSNSSHSSSSRRSSRSSSGSSYDHDRYYRRGGSSSLVVRIFQGILIMFVAVVLLGKLSDPKGFDEKLVNFQQTISIVHSGSSGDSGTPAANLEDKEDIYVEEIGRTCSWNSEYESYYDKTTDCYFWKNDTINPPQWQYWFEGISSDYGDYGWMEYDFSENIWYIEVSDDAWEPLPGKYDTTELWHFSSI